MTQTIINVDAEEEIKSLLNEVQRLRSVLDEAVSRTVHICRDVSVMASMGRVDPTEIAHMAQQAGELCDWLDRTRRIGSMSPKEYEYRSDD